MLPARRHDISRIEAFSDAVFAFALTLLVVSLEVPLVSAGVGLFATLIALSAPWPFPVFSGFCYFLMGPADSLRQCLSARSQSKSITTSEGFRRAQKPIDQTLPMISVSFTSEKQSAISFVELFSKQERSAFSTSSEAIQQNVQTLPLAVSVTILKDGGLEWSSRSSFGILGSLFTTFAPARPR